MKHITCGVVILALVSLSAILTAGCSQNTMAPSALSPDALWDGVPLAAVGTTGIVLLVPEPPAAAPEPPAAHEPSPEPIATPAPDVSVPDGPCGASPCAPERPAGDICGPDGRQPCKDAPAPATGICGADGKQPCVDPTNPRP